MKTLVGAAGRRNSALRRHVTASIALTATLLMAVLVVAGCDGSESAAEPTVDGSPPRVSQLFGIWREVGGGSDTVFFQFKRDGTFALDTDIEVPYFAAGTYELRGDEISFDAEGPKCADAWVWRVGIVEGDRESEDDRLNIVFLDDGACTAEAGTEVTFGRI